MEERLLDAAPADGQLGSRLESGNTSGAGAQRRQRGHARSLVRLPPLPTPQ